jgi:hypothetical protein
MIFFRPLKLSILFFIPNAYNEYYFDTFLTFFKYNMEIQSVDTIDEHIECV